MTLHRLSWPQGLLSHGEVAPVAPPAPARLQASHRAVGVVLALACLALGVTAGHGLGSGEGARGAGAVARGSYSLGALMRLPAGARGPISQVLAREAGGYRISDLEAQNPAQKLRSAFSAGGVTIESGNGRLGMSLTRFGRSGAVREVSDVAPTVTGNRVGYAHRDFREWFANGPLGLEQGFNLTRRPAGGTAPLQFEMSVRGNLHASASSRGVLFSGHGVSLRYTGLTATDALGHRLPASLALRDGRLVISVDDRRARYPVRIDPFVQQAQLSVAGEPFGTSVAISGNTLVVGGYNNTSKTAAVYVFEEPDGGWSSSLAPKAILTSPAGSGPVQESTVAISGDTIVSGAFAQTTEAGESAGAAYVWDKPLSGWASTATPNAELTASDGARYDEFGGSVAVAGDTIVVGSEGHDGAHGEVYVFDQPGGGYTVGAKPHETTRLDASDGQEEDYFGRQVAISANGETIAASAPGHSATHAPKPGAVYVFQEVSAKWTQSAELYSSDSGFAPRALGEYSLAISASGDTIAAPALNASYESGEVEVWSSPEGGWAGAGVQAAELTNPAGATGQIGYSAAISSDTIVAGALQYKAGGSSQGAIYVYAQPKSGGWVNATPNEVLTASSQPLGSAVATTPSGETIFGGAEPFEIEGYKGPGSVYVFDLQGAIESGGSGGSGGSGTGGGSGTTTTTASTVPAPAPTPTPTVTPKPKIPSLSSQFGLPSSKACLSKRKLTIHVAEHVVLASSTVKIKSAQVLLAGHVVAKLKASNLIAHVSLVGLKKGSFKITVKVTTTAGKRLSATATFHTCVRSKAKHK